MKTKISILSVLLLTLCLLGSGCYRKNLPPDKNTAAVVLGKPVKYTQFQADKEPIEEFVVLVKGPLLDQYIKDNHITVTEKDYSGILKKTNASFDETLKEVYKEETPTPEEKEKMRKDYLDTSLGFFKEIIKSQKVAKSLFEKYGGRVCISSFGFVVPIDAETKYFKEREAAGDFKIYDKELAKAFWKKVSAEWGDGTLSEKKAEAMFADPKYGKSFQ